MFKAPDNLADGRHRRPANDPAPARQTQENTRETFLTPLARMVRLERLAGRILRPRKAGRPKKRTKATKYG